MVDHNVGKLARWLRMMGLDTLFFDSGDDSHMVARALSEDRMILTRDTGIMKRRVVKNGRLKAVLIDSEEPERQMCQLMDTLGLEHQCKPFTLCLECNQPLVKVSREDVKERVPPHVYKTHNQYMECPVCHRIYWQGTHWEAMVKKLKEFSGCTR